MAPGLTNINRVCVSKNSTHCFLLHWAYLWQKYSQNTVRSGLITKLGSFFNMDTLKNPLHRLLLWPYLWILCLTFYFELFICLIVRGENSDFASCLQTPWTGQRGDILNKKCWFRHPSANLIGRNKFGKFHKRKKAQ